MPNWSQAVQVIKTAIKPIWYLVSILPIYGQLVDSNAKNLKSACCDIAITTFFSLFPLWLYPIFSWVTFDFSLKETLKTLTSNGELFLYSAALVGPLIYAITKRYGVDEDDETDEKKTKRRFTIIKTIEFPYGRIFIIISVLTCIFSALFFTILQASNHIQKYLGFEIPLERENLFLISVILYAFTLSCLFCVSVYRLDLESIPKRINEDTHKFVDEWNHRYD